MHWGRDLCAIPRKELSRRRELQVQMSQGGNKRGLLEEEHEAGVTGMK